MRTSACGCSATLLLRLFPPPLKTIMDRQRFPTCLPSPGPHKPEFEALRCRLEQLSVYPHPKMRRIEELLAQHFEDSE